MTDSTDRLAAVRRLMEEAIPFNRLLGMRADLIEPGHCVLRVPWRDEFTGDPRRPAVHGGVISALADTAGGLACFSALSDPSDRVSTVDLRVDYLLPLHGLDLVCEANVVRMGNRVAVTRMEVFGGELPRSDSPGDGEREPVATAQAVYNVMRADDRRAPAEPL